MTATREDLNYFDSIAENFSNISAKIFEPLYSEIVEYVESEGHPEGIAADLGSGPGSLAIKLSNSTGEIVLAIDISRKMLKILLERIASSEDKKLVEPVLADVHSLPIRDASLALIVSRGSAPFWNNMAVAFGEAFRCLKEGGMMFIGGGLGMKEETRKKVKEALGFRGKVADFAAKSFSPELVKDEVSRAKIPAEVLWGDFGLWVKARK